MDVDGRKRAGPRVAIIGAGMSGLCVAHRLTRMGVNDFVIHEKAGDVGGTWRENTYPGLTCDVPSRFYSYSFAPNPDWSSTFSPGPEIHAYFRRFAEQTGLRERIRFGSEVTSAEWRSGHWALRTAKGVEERADVLIAATGFLHHPRYPDIEGVESFEGPCFHSARWDHSVPLPGQRIGVIGTGSTGVQITTALAGVAGRLDVFQRSAQWVLSARNRPYSATVRRAYRRFPALARWSYRFNQRYLELLLGVATVRPGWQRSLISWLCRRNLAGVKDPELRRKLTPDYEPMCKRLVLSGEFYDAIQKPGVELVTDAIERVEPGGVRTADGRLHELDVLVLATGFDFRAFMRPMQMVGEDGLTLEEAWADGPRAYRTVALPGFPNFFMMVGPHSPIGNHSLCAIAETQADFIAAWIERMRAGEVAAVAPTATATDRFNAEMQAAMPDTIWTTGCSSWYLGEDGRPELWPWTPDRHRELLRVPDPADFVVQPQVDSAAS